MKTLLTVLLAAMIGLSGTAHAQQPYGQPAPQSAPYGQPAPYGQQPSANQQSPSAGAQRFPTCSQTLAYCEQGCSSGYRQSNCRNACQQRQSECMSTGIWTSANGQKSSKQRQ
jgi:hypothetical protein